MNNNEIKIDNGVNNDNNRQKQNIFKTLSIRQSISLENTL